MEEKRIIRVGSRDSKLAVEQTMLLVHELEKEHPELIFELVTMKTTGDQILNRSLEAVGGKGLFVRELDQALVSRNIDIAVHSLKDMPMEQPEGLPIVAVAKRGEPRDVLVYPTDGRRWSSESGRPLRIGTSSARRRLQLKRLFPEAEFPLLRGNVITRLCKLDEGQYDMIVLAAAGLLRLGLADRIGEYLEPEQVIPAAGQGILAVQGREGEDYSYLDCIADKTAWELARAERGFVRYLDGGCSSPVAAYGEKRPEGILLRGLYYEEETGQYLTGTITGDSSGGERLGVRLAKRLQNEAEKKKTGTGKVYLVGAGPSDPGLLTLKGKALLDRAEVVVYDRLVGAGILQMIPAAAERIDVGKQAGRHPVPQAEINRILLKKAMEGKTVVRLKGGDPFVFGRGGEELLLLAEHGIPFEVVPGVTAASAVPAYAGIPVTHRDYSSSVHLITAHKKQGGEEKLDFDVLAKLTGTLVFYMGLGTLDSICRGLMEAGMDGGTPAAVLERGTTAAGRRVVATVATLKEEADRAKIETPALIVVGRVCSLADQLYWAEDRPLGKRRILVTRPKKRSQRLADRLEALGAEVILLPAIETKPVKNKEAFDKAMEILMGQEVSGRWIAFTSAEGVDCFFEALLETGKDIRFLNSVKFAVIGPATGRALSSRGILADLMPEPYTGEALGKALAGRLGPEDMLLLPRARIGTETLLAPLKEAGIPYEELPVYDTVEGGAAELTLLPGDIVTFTSASTVRGFVKMFPDLDYTAVTGLCIGEQTAAEAEKYGIRTVVSERADIEAMVEKLLELPKEEIK